MKSSGNHYKNSLRSGEPLPEVTYSELKDGSKGVSIGEEELFLAVKRKGERWSLRLFNMFGEQQALTGWMTVKDVEHLRGFLQARPLRERLEAEYGDRAREVLERVIMTLQDHAEKWQLEEAPEVGEKQGESIQAAPDGAEARRILRELHDIQPDITEEVLREHALTFLRSPNLLFQVKQIYEKGVMVDRYRFVLGEDDKKLLTFAIAASAKTLWPQSLWATGTSGFGKTNMIMVTLALMPPGYAKVRSYLTGAGLRYGSQDYKVLFIREWRQFAEQDIRLVSREDGAYTYEIAVR
ncbi:MAG: hypothetical protein ACTSXC_07725, partial [Candidatus Freyarchaeota archaeon]